MTNEYINAFCTVASGVCRQPVMFLFFVFVLLAAIMGGARHDA
jgi:hypothetical protein